MVEMSRNSLQFSFQKDPSLKLEFLRLGAHTVSRKNSCGPKSQRLFRARNAIYLALAALGLVPNDELLVPAYICGSAVEAIHAYGARPVFYRIKTDCSTDLLDVESKVGPRTRALLMVHYFGFPNQDIRELRNLCYHYNFPLIEDCAHVLCGNIDGVPLGEIGDVAVFSFRKFLPIPDGAELRLNSTVELPRIKLTREPYTSTLRSAVDIGEKSFSFIPKVISSLKRAAKFLHVSSVQQASEEAVACQQQLHPQDTDSCFVLKELSFPMSRVSRWIMIHTDMNVVIEKRRQNYLKLGATLRNMEGTQLLFPDLPGGICPWVLPLIVRGVPRAHWLLRERGIPAVAWDGVRPRELNTAEFTDAMFLYTNLIFLPVHQNLEQYHLDSMLSAIKSARDSAQ